MVVIKILSRTASSATQTAYMGLFMTPITLSPALFFWEWPTIAQYGWFCLTGIAGTLGPLAFAQAFRQAHASAVLAPDSLRIIGATLAGWLVFAEVPDLWPWTGA